MGLMRRVWLMVLFVSACGDSGGVTPPDVRGMYMMVHHTRADAPSAADLVSCVDEGPEVTDVAYFRIADDTFFGHGMIVEECDDAAGSSCVERFESFLEARADGWESTSFNTQQGGGTECNLYHSKHRIRLNDDGTVTVTFKDWFATSTADNCYLSDAEALGDEPDCMLHEVMVGELVP